MNFHWTRVILSSIFDVQNTGSFLYNDKKWQAVDLLTGGVDEIQNQVNSFKSESKPVRKLFKFISGVNKRHFFIYLISYE